METELKKGDLVELETDNGQFYHGHVWYADTERIELEDVDCNMHLLSVYTIKAAEVIEAADDGDIDLDETLPGDPEAVEIFKEAMEVFIDSAAFIYYLDWSYQRKRRVADLYKLLKDIQS